VTVLEVLSQGPDSQALGGALPLPGREVSFSCGGFQDSLELSLIEEILSTVVNTIMFENVHNFWCGGSGGMKTVDSANHVLFVKINDQLTFGLTVAVWRFASAVFGIGLLLLHSGGASFRYDVSLHFRERGGQSEKEAAKGALRVQLLGDRMKRDPCLVH